MIRPYTSINMPLWSKVLVCSACHPCLLQYDSFHLNPFKTNMWQLSTHHTSRHLWKVPKVQQSTRLFSSVKDAWIKGFTMHYGTLLAQWMSLQLKSISKRGPWLKWGILTVTGFLHILHSKPCKVCFLFLFFSLSLLGTLVEFMGLGNGANWVTEKTCQLVRVVKGNLVFDLKHGDALQTFYTFWGLLWMFGTGQCGHDCE